MFSFPSTRDLLPWCLLLIVASCAGRSDVGPAVDGNPPPRDGSTQDGPRPDAARIDGGADAGGSRRPFQLALYHGGVQKSLSPSEYQRYLAELAAFVAKRKIDKVFVDVGGYDAMPYSSPAPLAEFLNALPPTTLVGAVMEINPKYAFQYDKPLLPGGLTCVAKATPTSECPLSDNPASAVPGCPNNMEKAYDLLAAANRLALERRADTTLFTDFIADKENAGIYGGRICNFIESAKKYIVPSLPTGYRGATSEAEKLGLIQVGFAGEGSLNAPDLMARPICGATDDACTSYPYELKNVEAFPELYWYMRELKEKGCVGCDHTLTAQELAATRPSECESCKDPACAGAVSFFTSGDPYDQCMRSGCPASCCKCLGCVPCRYDATGAVPNPAIIYQKYLNQPVAMADAVVDAITTYALLDNLKRENTWSMFSIELAHDWRDISDPVSGKRYSADGATSTSADTCVARRYGGDICGTFDGFGNWSWEAFEQFLYEYHRRTGITKIAIYEWQFVFPEWR
ncbi:MAG: hypothetical protein HY698_17860 [Deltaproteobacteria bacterium]|nr:hypothetical protein [Deltaproteobacteria bacterium]